MEDEQKERKPHVMTEAQQIAFERTIAAKEAKRKEHKKQVFRNQQKQNVLERLRWRRIIQITSHLQQFRLVRRLLSIKKIFSIL